MPEKKEDEVKFEVYNSDGEPIEGVLAPEEIKTLQAQLEETKGKLSKLENKEFNFRKLESMTEEEKEKLTATELSLKEQAEALEERQRQMESTFISDVKNDILSSLVGDDNELRKKVELNYDRLKDSSSARSRDDIRQLLSDAYTLSVGNKSRNPIVSANNTSGTPIVKGDKMSDELVSFAKKFGVSEEELTK